MYSRVLYRMWHNVAQTGKSACATKTCSYIGNGFSIVIHDGIFSIEVPITSQLKQRFRQGHRTTAFTTFGRMGKIAGLGDRDVKMLRMGEWRSDETGTTQPFATDVDADDYDEAWGIR